MSCNVQKRQSSFDHGCPDNEVAGTVFHDLRETLIIIPGRHHEGGLMRYRRRVGFEKPRRGITYGMDHLRTNWTLHPDKIGIMVERRKKKIVS